MLPGDVDDLLEEVQFDALRGRIAGEVEHQHLGLGPGILDRLLQLLEEIHVRRQPHMTHVGPGDDEAVGMDRIGRIGHQHGVARAHGGERQMGQALLGTDGQDGLALGVQMHVEAIAIPVADGAAQTRNAARHRIAMRIRTLRGLDELVDDVLGRALVRVAHAEVDDVLAPGSRLGLQLIDDVEDIGRQPLDAVKV